MLLNPETINEVKQKMKVYDVISDYVVLANKGERRKDYFGQCPFHEEKTASFSVNAKDNLYYCFGCHAGGDAISFLQRYKSIQFTDAVIEIAQKIGIEVKLLDEDKQKEYEEIKSEKEKLYEMLAIASSYYEQQLNTVIHTFNSYFQERGLNSNTIKEFNIGFARNVKDGLYQHFLHHIPQYQDVYVKTGLFKDTDYGLIDFFRNRLIIPIRDNQGRIVGFGGRAFGEDLPKYVNSPETLIFKKSENIFGLNVAKETVNSSRVLNSIILTEGYFDVMALHQIGFKNAVACLGTALTSSQIKQILKITNKLYLNLDSDNAGNEATEKIIKSLEVEIKNDLVDLKIISLDSKDASDFVKTHGVKGYDLYKSFVNKSKNWIDWCVESKLKNINLNDNREWKDFFNYLIQIVSKLDDIERIKYIQYFSEILSRDKPETQTEIYNLFIKRLKINKNNNLVDLSQKKKEKIEQAELTESSEATILKIYINIPEYRRLIRAQLLVRNIEFFLSKNQYFWEEIKRIEVCKDDDLGNFIPDEKLSEKLKKVLADNQNNDYQTYFDVPDEEMDIFNKAIIQILMFAFNYIEKRILEIRLKAAHEIYKSNNNEDYFRIFRDYFEQLKKVNQALNI